MSLPRWKVSLTLAALLVPSTFFILPVYSERNPSRMLLSMQDTMHFRSDVPVSKGRLSWSPPAFRCTGGYCATPLESITCKNRQLQVENGWWECTYPGMPPKACLTELAINCEGFAKDADQYILAGSCALEYSLWMNCQEWGIPATEHKRRTQGGGTIKREGKYLLGSKCGWSDFLGGLFKKGDIDKEDLRPPNSGTFIISRRKQLSGETSEQSDTNK